MELLSLGRMAARLGVTRGWLREQAAARKVPALVAGKRFLFNPVAVLDALAVQAARPVSDAGRGQPKTDRVPPKIGEAIGKHVSEGTTARTTGGLVGVERVEPMPRADAVAVE